MNQLKTIISASALALLMTTGANAQGQVSYMKQHNDWKVECTEMVNPESKKVENACLMSSPTFVEFKADKGQEGQGSRELVLNTSVTYLGKDKHPSMLFTTLLGNSLLNGLKFDIDGNQLTIGGEKVDGLPFNRCLPDGCVAGFQINDDKALESIKGGNKMNVVYTHFIFEGNEDNVKLEVSLSGFTAAYDDLKAQMGK